VWVIPTIASDRFGGIGVLHLHSSSSLSGARSIARAKARLTAGVVPGEGLSGEFLRERHDPADNEMPAGMALPALRGATDAQTSQALAVDSGTRDGHRQADHISAVGRGASPRGWRPSPKWAAA
jgi:hypothetical protein